MKANFLLITLTATLITFRTKAQTTTYTVTDSASAFLATGSPGNQAGTNLTANNYGGAGALVVASAANTNGEFQALLRFNVSGATNLFNSAFGTNNWVVSGISLSLAGNYGVAGEQPNNKIYGLVSGGQFAIEWLANDSWIQGTGMPNANTTNGVSYSSLPALLALPHQPLVTNTYVPPGDNIRTNYALPLNTNLLNSIVAGTNIDFRFFAVDNQVDYFFNSAIFGHTNQPFINISAVAASLRIISGGFSNAIFHLNGMGAAGVSYSVQASTNLMSSNWVTLGSVMATSSGAIQFDDTNAPNYTARYYRLSN